MTTPLLPYSVVRVMQLLRPKHSYDDWLVNLRQPKVGDIGTVVEVLQAENSAALYVVESVTPVGQTLWLSGFLSTELALVRSEVELQRDQDE